jgi:glycerol kinase
VAELILSIDQGTSATKACVFEPPGRLLGAASVPVERRSPAAGAVEQDPEELVESCRGAATAALREASVAVADLAGCALANTGESFLLFDGPGKPLTPVIGWQDSRVGRILDELEARELGDRITELTGLPLHAEFSAPKAAYWLRALAAERGVRFGTLDTWIATCLDPSAPFVTDRATAGRTMLIGLTDENWNAELTEAFGLRAEALPRIRPCDSMDVSLEIEGTPLPLLGSGYDMGVAVLGHACFEPGETKATFGTCLGVMSATGTAPRRAEGLLTTIAYTRGRRSHFAFDGEIAAAGALVQWALEIGIAGSVTELERLAESVSDSAGAIVVPAITGLGAPHWRDDVRGRITGLTEAVGRAELARAVFDAIAFSLRDVLEAIRASGAAVDAVRVDGGLARSELLLRRCADICATPMVRVAQGEATAFGVAALAMLANGSATEADLRAAVVDGASTVGPRSQARDSELEAWREAVAEVLG